MLSILKVFNDAQGSAKRDVQSIDQNGLHNIWEKVQANSRPTELSKRVFKVIVAVFLLKPMHKGVQAIMVVSNHLIQIQELET